MIISQKKNWVRGGVGGGLPETWNDSKKSKFKSLPSASSTAPTTVPYNSNPDSER